MELSGLFGSDCFQGSELRLQERCSDSITTTGSLELRCQAAAEGHTAAEVSGHR
jgi:hypothetical protein